MRTFNIGIIGYGGFGKFLHNAWSQLENVRVIAIADPHPEKLKEAQSTMTFTEWKDILDVKEIEMIAIVTDPSTHEMIATACMLAGKHVLIEKPLAITTKDAQALLDIRDKTKTIAAIDFIMRFNPLLQEIRRLMQQGVFGKLRRVDVENYAQDQQLPLDHWFWNPGRSGGILIEHAVHFIDLVHYLSPSKPIAVNGLKHNRNPQQEDQIMANVLYEDGVIATHYHAFSRPGFFEITHIRLACDLADIVLHGWIPLKAEMKVVVNADSRQILQSSEFFELEDTVPIASVTDESRPAGWGISDDAQDIRANTVMSGGIQYDADEVITGTLSLGRSKQEVYSECVQSSLLDVLKKIENPNHILTAPLEAGLSSLEIAVRATESARSVPRPTLGMTKNENDRM